MIKTVRSKKLVLDTAIIEEEFFEDVLLIGIVSSKPAYQFIWHINKAFNIDFTRNHAYEIEQKNIFYSLYTFEEKDKLREHFMFSNRKQQQFLLPELKNVDYIWMLKGGYGNRDLHQQILQNIPQLTIVTYSFDINSETLKNRENMIL